MSNSIIFVGAVVRFFGFSVFEHNPDKNATIIDYNLVSIMFPLVLVGSFIGTIIQNILPEALLTIILVFLLLYLTIDSFKKALKMWK